MGFDIRLFKNTQMLKIIKCHKIIDKSFLYLKAIMESNILGYNQITGKAFIFLKGIKEFNFIF